MTFPLLRRSLLLSLLSLPVYAASPAPTANSPAATASPSAQTAGVDASALMQAADRARGTAADGISWQITVNTDEGDGQKTTVSYQVKAKGNNAVARAVAPARNKGETMLFNDRTLWFFKPGLKKPVSISPRQKLMGQAANGDIASTNYYRDYDGKIVGEEAVGGKPAWKLELKAKAKNVTYDAIRYWISKDDRVGVKAEFLTVSGEVFKSATFSYGNAVTINGAKLPFVSTMTITDALHPEKVTTISYDEPKMETHPDSAFNINNLLR